MKQTLSNLNLNPENWQGYIKLPKRITHQQFGCSDVFFVLNVRNKKLKVTGYFGGFIFVEIKGEIWHVHESDLLPDGHDDIDKQERWQKAREAGQETENEWQL